MPKLILVRHGQTDFNAQQRYQGQSDIPLNATGIAQAEALRPRLAAFRLDAAYTSDLMRARQTAEVLLASHPSGVVPRLMPMLREASGGKFEGLRWSEITSLYPEEAALWQKDRMKHSPPEGESQLQVMARVQQAIEKIVEEQPGEERSVLVVAHGGIQASLLCHLMGVDPNRLWQWRIDNCSITILDIYKEGAILSLFNDVSYLDVADLEKREPDPAAVQGSRPKTDSQSEANEAS